MINKKIAAKLVFGAGQALLASSYIVLALFLKFDVFNSQASLSVPADALNFYVVALLALGFVLVVGGLFLVFDCWESR